MTCRYNYNKKANKPARVSNRLYGHYKLEKFLDWIAGSFKVQEPEWLWLLKSCTSVTLLIHRSAYLKEYFINTGPADKFMILMLLPTSE